MQKQEDLTTRAGRIVSGVVLGVLGVAFGVASVVQDGGAPEDGAAVYTLPDARLDLNSADAGTLELLPGIGVTLGERIVEHRETHGAFSSVADLERVHGIGPRKVEGVREYVVVSGVD